MTTAGDVAANERKIVVSAQALQLASRHAAEAVPKETGGILVGWWESPNTAVVHDLLLVPDRKAGRWHYMRSHRRAQQVLDRYREGGDPRVGYLGEWHSHPEPQPPSETDVKELVAIVRQRKSRGALIVLAVDRDQSVRPSGLIGLPRSKGQVDIEHAPIEQGARDRKSVV